jgi:TetR/AcrR family transcriptional regulator, lmrAB and yxaGH operons repressor
MSSRDGFIDATAHLLRRQGYAATGLNEITARSGAPRGSLYFHFPAGKEQLAVAAMERAGEQLRAAIESIVASCDDVGEALARLVDVMAAGLERSGFEHGCPIATVALEAATASEEIRSTADQVFDSWLDVLAARVESAGVEPDAARRRATLVLAAIEGALILARARADVSPLLAVRAELIALYE